MRSRRWSGLGTAAAAVRPAELCRASFILSQLEEADGGTECDNPKDFYCRSYRRPTVLT
jgi:hypothetical protein